MGIILKPELIILTSSKWTLSIKLDREDYWIFEQRLQKNVRTQDL